MKVIRECQTRQVHMSLGDDGILRYVYYRPGTIETLEDAQENLKVLFEFLWFTRLERHHTIVDMTNLRRVEHGVRQLYRSKEVMDLTGLNAIVAKSAGARLIANLFLKVDKPENPIRIFADEKEALFWIQKNIPNFKSLKRKQMRPVGV